MPLGYQRWKFYRTDIPPTLAYAPFASANPPSSRPTHPTYPSIHAPTSPSVHPPPPPAHGLHRDLTLTLTLTLAHGLYRDGERRVTLEEARRGARGESEPGEDARRRPDHAQVSG